MFNITDVHKVVLVRKALYQGQSLKTAVFNNKLTLKEYRHICRELNMNKSKKEVKHGT